jgi:hypothetical protein
LPNSRWMFGISNQPNEPRQKARHLEVADFDDGAASANRRRLSLVDEVVDLLHFFRAGVDDGAFLAGNEVAEQFLMAGD